MFDKTQTWDVHHRLELTLDGEFALAPAQLMMNDMYYNRPYYELIFLTKAEHVKLHNKARTFSDETRRKISESMKGHTVTDETRRKMSEARKGENNPNFGKHRSEETRRKMTESLKGRTFTEEWRIKISEANKGRTSTFKGRTHSEETRRKISEALKRRWAATVA